MTMPQEPQGQEPAATQQPDAGQTGQQNPAQGAEAQDVSQLPEWAQKAIRDARADAGKARTSAKQQAAEEARQKLMQEIGQTLGYSPDGKPTLEDLQRQLAEQAAENEEHRTYRAEVTYEKAVHAAAKSAGLDGEALYDSGSFRDAVAEKLDDDFDDDDLRKAVAETAKEQRFAKNSRFAAQRGAARSGADFTGAPSAPPNIDQAIADATEKKDFRSAIALKRARARAGQ